MDGLKANERAAAWLASWHPSFVGKAIVNPDFTFRAVNPQFCEILGVTPADLLETRFTDITPPDVREIDAKNAMLVKEGKIRSYLLEKAYEFPHRKPVQVTLLVSGVFSPSGEFLFFVSSIMKKEQPITSAPLCQQPTGLLEWVDKKKLGWWVLSGLVAFAAAVGQWFAQRGE